MDSETGKNTNKSQITNQKSKILRALAAQMDEALQNGEAERFNRLAQKRSAILQELYGPGNALGQAPEDMAGLMSENRRWLARLGELREKSRHELDKLQLLKKATKHLSLAYDRPVATGRYIARKG